jgi:hypothetical protein
MDDTYSRKNEKLIMAIIEYVNHGAIGNENKDNIKFLKSEVKKLGFEWQDFIDCIPTQGGGEDIGAHSDTLFDKPVVVFSGYIGDQGDFLVRLFNAANIPNEWRDIL